MARICDPAMHPYIAAPSNRGERLCPLEGKGNLRRALKETNFFKTAAYPLLLTTTIAFHLWLSFIHPKFKAINRPRGAKKQKTVSQCPVYATPSNTDTLKNGRNPMNRRQTTPSLSFLTTSLPVSRRSTDDVSYRQFFWLGIIINLVFPSLSSVTWMRLAQTLQRRDRTGL